MSDESKAGGCSPAFIGFLIGVIVGWLLAAWGEGHVVSPGTAIAGVLGGFIGCLLGAVVGYGRTGPSDAP